MGLRLTGGFVAELGGFPTAAAPEELLLDAGATEVSLFSDSERRRGFDLFAGLFVEVVVVPDLRHVRGFSSPHCSNRSSDFSTTAMENPG